MDWVGAATAIAAGLAAALSGLTLYVSGRRDLDQWTRETLVETVTTLLEGSFQLAGLVQIILRGVDDSEEQVRLRERLLAAHATEGQALTRLRIVGEPEAVAAAVRLVDSEYALAEACFFGRDPHATYDALIGPVHARRAEFVWAARRTLRLRGNAAPGDLDLTKSWSDLSASMARPGKTEVIEGQQPLEAP